MSPDDAPLVALLSPDGVSGLEVIEHALPAWIRRTLAQAAPAVRTAIQGYAVGLQADCYVACGQWAPRLVAARIGYYEVDGKGDGPDVFDAGYRAVPLEHRGGYAVGHPEGVTLVPHRWFLVGPDRHVFDPTGHQFSGGRTGAQVDLWRYRIDGLPISRWRRLEATGELPPHAAEAGVLWTA